jgi:hypothetical protein
MARAIALCTYGCAACRIISSSYQLCHCGGIEQPQWHGIRRWRSRASFARGTRSDLGIATASFPRPFDVEMHGLKRGTIADHARVLRHSHGMPRDIFRAWRRVSLTRWVLPSRPCRRRSAWMIRLRRSAHLSVCSPHYAALHQPQCSATCTLLPHAHVLAYANPPSAPYSAPRIAWQHRHRSPQMPMPGARWQRIPLSVCGPVLSSYTTCLHRQCGGTRTDGSQSSRIVHPSSGAVYLPAVAPPVCHVAAPYQTGASRQNESPLLTARIARCPPASQT